MKSRLNLFWLTIVIGCLSGCATMSGDECMTSDWSAIGYEDGSRGFATERFGQHRKACAKHGVTPDFSAYQHGREQGLVEFCQPHRGFNVGSSGGGYNGVCSVNLEADFLDAYNAGYHLYSLRSNLNRANSSIRSKEKELEQIEDTLIKDGVAIIAADTTQEQRILILADMKRLAERTGKLQAEIKELHHVRARSQVELDHYQLVVADMGY
ncbi:MAG: DUF2799 domain-containing protein [Gammaproteobacteria bacterium]|jgi:hypothetical protein|nr:DUF2799 domain-containing protein [Gammaproteobacteria bacterium]